MVTVVRPEHNLRFAVVVIAEHSLCCVVARVEVEQPNSDRNRREHDRQLARDGPDLRLRRQDHLSQIWEDGQNGADRDDHDQNGKSSRHPHVVVCNVHLKLLDAFTLFLRRHYVLLSSGNADEVFNPGKVLRIAQIIA